MRAEEQVCREGAGAKKDEGIEEVYREDSES